MEIGPPQINTVARLAERPSLIVKTMRDNNLVSRVPASDLSTRIAAALEVVGNRPAQATVLPVVGVTGQATDRYPAVRAEETLAPSVAPPGAGAQQKPAVRAGVPAWAEEAAGEAAVAVAGGGGRRHEKGHSNEK
jgi:hypothetical protein